ncbi:hypothetical protein HDU83_002140 [Entophlyctis luteolus]|nr:hypothetical protein HDU83_002140 [Entophlyctis luteolus]
MDTPNAAPSDQYLEPQRDTDKYEGHTVILRKNKAAATARQMQTPSPSQSPVPRSALVLTRDAGTVMRESTEIASDPLVADNFHSPIGMAAEHQPLLSDSEGYRAPLSAGAMRVSDDIRYTQWSVPPPQHSQTDREADYRFGASISWKLGSVMGVSASVASLVGYLFIPDTNIANTMMPFIVAIGVMLIHALLLLAISLRLGAYRAPHAEYHHSRPTWLYSNPDSAEEL